MCPSKFSCSNRKFRIVNICCRSRSLTGLYLWVSMMTLFYIPPCNAVYFSRQTRIKNVFLLLSSCLNCRNDLYHRSLKHLWFLIFRKKKECILDFEVTKDKILYFHLKWQGRRMECGCLWEKFGVFGHE